MTCRLFCTKPLTEPILTYSQLDLNWHVSMKFSLKFKSLHSRKCFWKCRLQKVGHVYSGVLVLNKAGLHEGGSCKKCSRRVIRCVQDRRRWYCSQRLGQGCFGVRLLHSSSLVAIGLSVGYETWPPIGWHQALVIVWSKYRLGLPSAPLHYGITWPVGIRTVFQTLVTVPLCSPDSRQMPGAVQGNCERVYFGVETRKTLSWVLQERLRVEALL